MPNYHQLHRYLLSIKTTSKLFLVAFFLFALTNQESQAQRNEKVLVLHSYHQGLEWTDNITKGIQSVFSQHKADYELYYEYLDTKRNTGTNYIDNMVNFLLTRNVNNRYEVIIVSDNIALNLINEGRIYFTGDPPLVFCGINNFSEELVKNIDNFTGVTEKADHRATVQLMQKLHPERNTIIVIIDQTPTGEAIRKEFKEIESHYNEELDFVFIRNFLLDEIPAKLSNIDDQSLIYITTFNRDRNNNFISYSEGIKLITSNTTVPVYGPWDFYLDKGIVGGKITSGYLQGQAAGKLALKILHGHKTSDLPVITNSSARYMFDHNILEQHGISVSSLPSDSLVINSPPTAYERYKTLLIGITLLPFSIVVFLLLRDKQQRSAMATKQALADKLENMVFKRTQELERANKELLRLSNLDGLTQIYNRRYFDSALDKEVNRLQRTSTPLSLLLCDIDHFKQFNDTYGHLAGDDCIKSVANTIQKHCKRITDIAARYGGEEFGIILPNTEAKGAVTLAESIRRTIEQKNIAHITSPIKEVVTLSIGIVSTRPDIHTTPSALIRLADEALYESKHKGRNRVELKTQHD
jgi:diguanylate cyclase (GGDEF)-like protein